VSCQESFGGEILEIIASAKRSADYMLRNELDEKRVLYRQIVDKRIQAGKKMWHGERPETGVHS